MHIDDYLNSANLIESARKEISGARDVQAHAGDTPGLGAWMIAFAILVLAQVVLNTKGID